MSEKKSNKSSGISIEVEFNVDKIKRNVATVKKLSEIELDLPEIRLTDFAKAMENDKPIYCLKLQSLKQKGINMDSVPNFDPEDFVYVALQPMNVERIGKMEDKIVINGTIELPLKGRTIVEIDQAVLTNEGAARTLASIITEALNERARDAQELLTKVTDFYTEQLNKDRY